MKNLFNFLKKILQKEQQTPKNFPLGAFLNESDNRDIPYAIVGTAYPSYQPKITIKNFDETARLYQENLGTCVPHAFEFINRLDDRILHSRRIPYVITRKALGWTEANSQGLPQREGAKTFTIVGAPKDSGLDNNFLSHKEYTNLEITKQMIADSNIYRFGGFAFPTISVNGFKQALSDGKPIAITVAIDWGRIDKDGTIRPVRPGHVAGFHEVCIGEYDDATQKFRFANWWDPQWGTNRDGFIRYEELESVVRDAIVFTNIPENLLERAKTAQYIFTTDIKLGMKNNAVKQLQTRLEQYGVFPWTIDGDFGPKTSQAVRDYQRFKGLDSDGKIGPKTRQALNDDIGSGMSKLKIDLWCEAIKTMEGAKEYRNNPGNLVYIGQPYAVKDGRFCKFDTYAHGYEALRNLLIGAATPPDGVYRANMSLYEFYEVYAPASDGNNPKRYAEFVAKRIGVDPNVAIKTLLF